MTVALVAAEGVRAGCGQISGDKPPLVRAGDYELAYLYDETVLLGHGRVAKLVLWFRLVSPGDFFGVELPRYYNVERLEGKPRRYGDFKVKGWGNDFVRHYATLFGSLPQRKNRIPMGRFEGVIIRGDVRTVMSTWMQKTLPQALHYSTVGELKELLTNGPSVTPSPTPRPTPSPTPTLKQAETEGKG